MNKFVCFLVVGLYLSLPGCQSIRSTDVSHSDRASGLFSKMTLAKSPESNERVLSLARLMERQGRHEEAEKLYLGVLEGNPQERTACHRLGCLAVGRGEHSRGIEYFQRAAVEGDVSGALWNDMGYVLYLQHELSQAEANLREAIRKDPHFKNAHSNLGLVLAEQGKFDEALTEFRQSSDEAGSFSNLAFVQTRLGLLNEAENNYHRALALDPKHRQAAEALVQFAQLSRKVDAQAAQSLAINPSAVVAPPAINLPSAVPQSESQNVQLASYTENVGATAATGLSGQPSSAPLYTHRQ